ncbi:MAG: glycosyltransferase family 2 protein [Bacteroidetes bacterium]|nr:glycosyltransferase family 2 protein [Bacteroidota bacterium]
MIKLSVAIITFNEEHNIERCLQSVMPVADEVVVIDSYSTDSTEQICHRYGAKFIKHTFEGYIEQKNYAMAQATFDWVLSLDADEALDETLLSSIKKIKEQPAHHGYCMNRLANYCGQWIRHGGWYPDTKLRLFNRHFGKWGGYNPHDKFEFNNPASIFGKLTGNLLHFTFYNYAEHVAQTKRFAQISAKSYYDQGKRTVWGAQFVNPAFTFIKSYVLKLGFLEGLAGWRIATMMAYGNYLKYTERLHLQNRNR